MATNVTLIALYVCVMLVYGMSFSDSLSSHLVKSPWFAWALSAGVTLMGYEYGNWQGALWVVAWLGVLCFALGHEMHQPFTFLFLLAALLMAWTAPFRTRMLWVVAVTVPGAAWLGLYAANVANYWIPEYIGFIVYVLFWWYYLEYDSAVVSEVAVYGDYDWV